MKNIFAMPRTGFLHIALCLFIASLFLPAFPIKGDYAPGWFVYGFFFIGIVVNWSADGPHPLWFSCVMGAAAIGLFISVHALLVLKRYYYIGPSNKTCEYMAWLAPLLMLAVYIPFLSSLSISAISSGQAFSAIGSGQVVWIGAATLQAYAARCWRVYEDNPAAELK